jgi:hypothetical protein
VFTCELFVLNDRPLEAPGGRMTARLVGDTKVPIGQWDFGPCAPGRHQAVGSASVSLPPWRGDRFQLVVEVEGQPTMRSAYTLLFRSP